MKRPETVTARITGIDVAKDRYVSVNGPPITYLPGWGLLTRTDEVEYHLHPAITYEVHYCVPVYVLVHAFKSSKGYRAVGDAKIVPGQTSHRSTRIVPPGTPVRVIQETPLEFLALGIAPARIERLALQVGIAWQGLDEVFLTTDTALSTLCAEIRRSMITEPLGSEPYLDTLTDALLMRMITRHIAPSLDGKSSSETLPTPVAKRLAAFVEDGLSGPIQVTTLADQVGLSRSHFSRAFARKFGMPPRDYIMSRRVARARTLLVETDDPITRIAFVCGFANPSHLTTSFRSEMGLTPSAYRRALTERSD